MRKIILLIIFSILVIVCFSQDATFNHEKYWYYRFKMINDFMLIGQGQGKSIPAHTRDLRINGGPSTNILKWGDVTMDMGWYLGILATEYKLLKNNNQSTDQTVMELYYALEALNRLDYFAETYTFYNNNNVQLQTGTTPSLNGFFVRDDVPADFVNNNLSHFNQEITHGIASPNYVEFVNSDYGSPPTQNEDYDAKEMSLDQVCHLFIGFSLINALVDEDVEYKINGVPQVFSYEGAGETRIVFESRNIVDRIISYMRSGSTFPWVIENPVTGENVARGPFATEWAYGFAEAACKSTNKNDFTHLINGQTCFDYHFLPFNPAYTASLVAWMGMQAYLIALTNEGLLGTANTNDHLSGLLAAAGNSWYPTVTGPFSPLTNTTNAVLSFVFTDPIYGREYLPLLRQVVHGGGNLVGNQTYLDLLNSAPCTGSYSYGNCNYPNTEWSVNNRFRNPEHRGECTLVEGGEFCGRDYMLLYNLYCLAQPNYFPGYFNMMDRFVTGSFPFFVPLQNIFIGSQTQNTQARIEAFNTILVAAQHLPDAWVEYRAGVEITMEPGFFDADEGAIVDIIVDPFECSGSDYIRAAGNNTNGKNPVSYNKPTQYVYYPPSAKIQTQSSAAIPSEQALKYAKENSGIEIIPNPSGGKFELRITNYESGREKWEIEIYDILGRVIFQTAIHNPQTEIDLTGSSAGMYFVKVQSGEKIYTEKIIIR